MSKPAEDLPPPTKRSRQETTRTIALVGLFVIALFYGLHMARDVLLPVTLGILFAFLLGPPVRWLTSLKVPRSLAAMLVVVTALAAFGGIVFLLSSQAYSTFNDLSDNLSQLKDRLAPIVESVESMRDTSEQLQEIAGPIVSDAQEPELVSLDGESTTDNILQSAQIFLTVAGLTIVLLYFILASGDLFIRKIVRVVPSHYDSHMVYHAAVKIEHDIGLYLGSMVLINTGLGIAVGLMLWAMGMPNPLFWGVMAGVMNFIPYVGAIIMTSLVGTVALGMYEDMSKVILVVSLYLTLTAIEGFLVTPMVHGKRLVLNTAMVFFALIVWGALWGIPGLLLAVPISAAMKVIFDRIPTLKPIAIFLGR